MSSPNDAESLPDNIPALEERVAACQQRLQELDDEQRRLMRAEKPAEGVFFAQEIHANRQAKNQLQVEMQFAQVRLNRLKIEVEPF